VGEYCQPAATKDGAVVFCSLSSNPLAGRPASWLATVSGRPTVLVDYEYIRQQVALPLVPRAVARVVLHEVGHLAIHWRSLLAARPATSPPPDAQGKIPMPPCDLQQEAEAWWLAECIVAQCVGGRATLDRADNGNDQAWRIA
jgi:hypothetical protein